MNAGGKPKATVLVIDDEQIVHESVRRILEEEGYRVDGALRVDQALDMLAKETYDLVLTDLMMPDRSGMDAVQAVARDQPDTGVVMFTGFATVDSAVESMKLGALDYLPKPFTPQELIDVTEKALQKTFKARRDREIEKTYADAEKAMRSSLDLREILNLIGVSVVRLLRLKGASVFLYKTVDKTMELAASHGLSDEYLEKGQVTGEKSIAKVFETGSPVIVQKEEFDSSLQYPDAARKEGIAAIMSVPLKVHGAILGVLRLYGAERLSPSDEEMDLLLKFAEQGARALENAMRYEKVRADIEGLKKSVPETVTRQMEKKS
ncbi:MAG: response regulator [Deltaproteobacteria bacterium]|nr:response regulator [Deltaproteobacteria bacterium]